MFRKVNVRGKVGEADSARWGGSEGQTGAHILRAVGTCCECFCSQALARPEVSREWLWLNFRDGLWSGSLKAGEPLQSPR